MWDTFVVILCAAKMFENLVNRVSSGNSKAQNNNFKPKICWVNTRNMLSSQAFLHRTHYIKLNKVNSEESRKWVHHLHFYLFRFLSFSLTRTYPN